jgi:hypothetical protein
VSIAGQFLPPKQESGVKQVEQLVARAIGSGKAAHQGELLFPMLVPHEEVERIGRIAQGGQNGLDSDVSKDIVWSDV